MCVPSTGNNLPGLTVPKKRVMINFNNWRWEKKRNEIKGLISSHSLIPVYMIHLPTAHMCTKFQPSRPYSFWEKCDKNFNVWKLSRKKNKGMNKRQQPDSGIHETSIHCPQVYQVQAFKFQPSRPYSSWEKVWRKILMFWKLEKKKN